jgi:hypothetical protein
MRTSKDYFLGLAALHKIVSLAVRSFPYSVPAKDFTVGRQWAIKRHWKMKEAAN